VDPLPRNPGNPASITPSASGGNFTGLEECGVNTLLLYLQFTVFLKSPKPTYVWAWDINTGGYVRLIGIFPIAMIDVK
jgi:hypothetical protein